MVSVQREEKLVPDEPWDLLESSQSIRFADGGRKKICGWITRVSRRQQNDRRARPSGLPARLRLFILTVVCLAMLPSFAYSQTYVTPTTNNPPQYGPYSAIFLPGGVGLTHAIDAQDTVQMADAPWTMYAWIKPSDALTAPALIAGMGEPSEEYPRYLAASSQAVMLWDGEDNSLRFPLPAGTTFTPGTWHFIAASFDGASFHVYADGALLGSGTLLLGTVSPELSLAPAEDLPSGYEHFGGQLEGFTLLRRRSWLQHRFLAGRDRARHRAHHHGRSRHLSQPLLRPE